MAWARIDDGMPDHPKIRQSGEIGLAIATKGLCYASRWLTNGFLPERVVQEWIRPLGRAGAKAVEKLVEAPPGFRNGHWERTDGGFMIHDYLVYNPSKDDVEEERRAARERQSRYRSQRLSQRDSREDSRGDSERSNGVTNGGSNGVSDEVSRAHSARAAAGASPSPPVPSRPLPSPTHTSPPSPSPPGAPQNGGGELEDLKTEGSAEEARDEPGRIVWPDVLERLRATLDRKDWRTWFEPTRQIRFDEEARVLVVGVPNRTFAEWIRAQYLEAISTAILEACPGPPVTLELLEKAS